MAKPTLALIPAAQGSKLFSVLPSSGVGDFDFSRGSAATRINSLGLIETVASGVSRLNYPLIDGVVNGCPHHILEPQRTQLVQYSEAFDNAYWNKLSQVSITGNATISPTGALNADNLTFDNSGVNTQLYKVLPITNGVHTQSIFIKYISGSGTSLRFSKSSAVSYAVNLTFTNNGSVLNGAKGANVDDFLIENFGNNWFRVSITYSFTSQIEFNIYRFGGSGTDVYAIYGAQLEAGSFPTSYIPNYGTAAGVTRSAETANGAGDATTFSDSEGVLMAEISALSETTDVRVLSISDGTTSNMVFIRFDTLNRIIAEVTVLNGGSVNPLFIAPDITSFNKIALKWALNDVALWVNGIEVSTISVIGQFAPNTLNVMNLSMPNLANTMDAKTKQIQYFNTALTDSELEQLTSWISFTDMANGQLYTIE